MCPQLHTRTAKHHRNTSSLLSETHVLGGTSLDPQINTEKNQNIMLSILSAGKLMNNNSKNEKRLNSVASILPTAGKQKSTRVTSISPLKDWGDFAELLETAC